MSKDVNAEAKLFWYQSGILWIFVTKGLACTSRSGTLCVLWPLFWTLGCYLGYLSVFAHRYRI